MTIKFIGPFTRNITTIQGSVAMAILLTMITSCNTTKQTRPQHSNFSKQGDSILTDRDGNRYPVKKMAGNLWMTANLKLNIAGSYCYENADSNCEKYGRLYSWESAQQACGLLGKGWSLPTNIDWRQLALQYNVASDSVDYRRKAFKALLTGGAAAFNAVLGGGRDVEGKYARLEAHGFYWTATENDSTALYYNFAKGSQALYEQNEGEKPRAFSVRCVCKIDSLRAQKLQ